MTAPRSSPIGERVEGERRIAEIRDRLAKATQGPWRVCDGSPQALYEGPQTIACPCSEHGEPSHDRVLLQLNNHFAHEDDAQFIAHAPEDIAMLLQTIDELRHALSEETQRLSDRMSNPPLHPDWSPTDREIL